MFDIEAYLKSQFQIRNVPAVRDRDALLRLSGQRWISDGPKEPPWRPEGPASMLDHCLDQYLWFLPVPRFDRQFEGPGPDDIDLVYAAVALLSALKAEGIVQAVHALDTDTAKWDPETIASLTDECFRAAVPLLEVLRDPDVPVENIKILVALMVLDFPLSMKLSRTFVRSADFVVAGLEAVHDDTKKTPTTGETALYIAMETTKERQLAGLLKKANRALRSSWPEPTASWTPWARAVEQGLVSADMQGQVEELLQRAVQLSGATVETLEKALFVDSLVFERPTFGFAALHSL